MKKSEYTKTFVLRFALKMIENDELVTAKALTNLLIENGKKIGCRSVASYLRILRNEGIL